MDFWLMWYDNSFTVLLMVIGFLLVLFAQIRINSAYSKYRRIQNYKGLTGYEVAKTILNANGLSDIEVYKTSGNLTDHYDPNRKVIKLSRNIYGNDTISSMAVAAHEVGHAIQDKEGYFFLRLRTFIFPIVSFISRMSWLVILVGFFFEIVNAIYLGIIIVSASVIFELVTLPVEINASKRAIKELNSLNLITGEEDKVKNVLTAAALTYVAGTLAEILQLIRLIGILKDND